MSILSVKPFSLGSSNIFSCTSSTAAATAAKEATMSSNSSYAPVAGDIFVIEFTNGVDVSSGTGITLNINNSGAKAWQTVYNTDDNAGMDHVRARIALVRYTGTSYLTIASDAPYLDVVTTAVNPTSEPTEDGAIWIETT